MNASDTLLLRLDRLEQVLAGDVVGREHDWTDEVCNALDELRQALRQHAESAEGLFGNVDLTRLSRRLGELCHEHREFMQQVGNVREEVQAAGQAFEPEASLSATATLSPGQSAGIPDFGAIREHGRELLDGLRNHVSEETGLVLEGVTTDIGAGD